MPIPPFVLIQKVEPKNQGEFDNGTVFRSNIPFTNSPFEQSLVEYFNSKTLLRAIRLYWRRCIPLSILKLIGFVRLSRNKALEFFLLPKK